MYIRSWEYYLQSLMIMITLYLQPLSILCHSFRDIDKYTAGFPRGDGQGHANLFKAVKHHLPGPVSRLSGSNEKKNI